MIVFNCALGTSTPTDTNTLLLVRGGGVAGTNVFTDLGTAATCPHTLTASGNPPQYSNTQTKFAATSIYFNGTGGRWITTTAPDTDWAFGSGSFTIDMWIYKGAGSGVLIGNTYNTNTFWALRTNISSPGNLLFNYGNGLDGTSTSTIPNNTWTHVAFERYLNTGYFYFNGTKDATTINLAAFPQTGLSDLFIGNIGADVPITAYFDEIRVSNTARYQGSNFVPETAPY